MNEAIVIAILAGVSIISLSFNIYQRVMLKMVSNKLLQEMLDRVTIEKKFSDYIQGIDNKDIEQTQGFVKFLSESRDWAFKYIEDVQVSIESLKSAVESGYDTQEEMQKLFEFLPENNKENNNE
jgi:hypothetical protein